MAVLRKNIPGTEAPLICMRREKIHNKSLEDATPEDLTPLHTKGKYGFGLEKKAAILDKLKKKRDESRTISITGPPSRAVQLAQALKRKKMVNQGMVGTSPDSTPVGGYDSVME